MGFLLNIMAAGAIFGAGYYVGLKRCENSERETAVQSSGRVSGGATYDKGVKMPYQEACKPCDGPAVAKYLLNQTVDGAAKVKKGIDELVQ